MQVVYEKIAIFDHYLASSRFVNGATVRCYKQMLPNRGTLVTVIAGVYVQHSREAHLTVLLRPFVTARYYGIHRGIVKHTNRDLHMPYSRVLFLMTLSDLE